MKQSPRTITAEESTKILAYFNRQASSDCHRFRLNRNYAMILTMLDTGMRVSEICKLRLTHIMAMGQLARSITIDKVVAKMAHARTIPFSDRLFVYLHQYSVFFSPFDGPRSEQYVFPQAPGGAPLSPRQVQRIVAHVSERTIGRVITPHILRHTFGTNLSRVASIKVVQDLLGHVSMSSTQVYLHPNHTDLTTAIKRMADNGKTEEAQKAENASTDLERQA